MGAKWFGRSKHYSSRDAGLTEGELEGTFHGKFIVSNSQCMILLFSTYELYNTIHVLSKSLHCGADN